MSTLTLADLGPRMRRNLGLAVPCPCSGTSWVATIPVIETVGPVAPAQESAQDKMPGIAWLSTGLHHLRIPAMHPQDAA